MGDGSEGVRCAVVSAVDAALALSIPRRDLLRGGDGALGSDGDALRFPWASAEWVAAESNNCVEGFFVKRPEFDLVVFWLPPIDGDEDADER